MAMDSESKVNSQDEIVYGDVKREKSDFQQLRENCPHGSR